MLVLWSSSNGCGTSLSLFPMRRYFPAKVTLRCIVLTHKLSLLKQTYRPCDIFLFTNIWTYEKQAKRHQKNATHHYTGPKHAIV
jgi:hypothetical protein